MTISPSQFKSALSDLVASMSDPTSIENLRIQIAKFEAEQLAKQQALCTLQAGLANTITTTQGQHATLEAMLKQAKHRITQYEGGTKTAIELPSTQATVDRAEKELPPPVGTSAKSSL